ncbi:nitrous oxide reductase family maturation protein NosD [Sinorhizobium meliloti]|uniref:right-handed parallel beta-helix repeat-containing protein n=1 Tax=Rhizobium meliloti TaxID=382 RepID=UPI001F38745D|nr:hypothetical protein [Sinorhizobium meliloti]
MSRPNISAFGMAALAAVILACPVSAATIRKSADGLPLQPVLDRASPGDVIVLQGEHQGPVTIDKTLTLEGEPGALVMGNGKGSVITVKAPQSIVRGLEVRGSGKDLYGMDSGIFVAQTASGARVEKNTIIGNLVGIYLHGARDSWALGNRIIGLREGRISEAGDGISVLELPKRASTTKYSVPICLPSEAAPRPKLFRAKAEGQAFGAWLQRGLAQDASDASVISLRELAR